MAVPSGTVSFLFTDIEGSTATWQTAPEAMREALQRHDRIVRAAVEAHRGYVFSTGGDGFGVAFARAGEAVAAAVEAQAALGAEVWPRDAPIRVRMGVHTGEAEERDGDYFGPALNRVARLMAAGHGGQVLCSSVTAELVGGEVVTVDLGVHRLRDLSGAQRIFQVGSQRFPGLRTLDVVSTNLPVVVTELIGRDADIAHVGRLVREQRLVTLTGPGGVGKTRLALAVAGQAAEEFPDGCWLVELGAVATGEEVVRAVASVVGASIGDAGGLGRYLGERRVLVVLDNCEHLLEATAALVGSVLAAGPEPVVVVTSRVLLGLQGEVVVRVRSLDVPDGDADVAQAAASEAVRLFVDRAGAGAGGFVLDDGNVGAVVEICRRLDGIPLAIEVAAARLRAMPAGEIAARLGERFRWSRRPGDHHHTLQATIDWSHGLLGEDEQVVFRRLGAFPASFDLDAAEAIAGGDAADVIESIVRLVDCSLVLYEPDEGRYRLLETLRQYAEDRLGDAGESDTIRARLARHFIALAQRIAPELSDARYAHAHRVLTVELDNLRAVVEWCSVVGRWAELAEMVLALWTFVFQAGPAACAEWFERLLRHEDELDPQTLVDVLGQSSWLAASHSLDYALADPRADRSISLASAHGVEQSPWAWVERSSRAVAFQGDVALADCERGLGVAEARHDEIAAVVIMGFTGLAQALLGDSEAADRWLDDALSRAERSGHPVSIQATTLTAAGRHLFSGGEPDLAGALVVLSRNDVRVDDSMATWADAFVGACLVGLHHDGAVGRLVRAARLADRTATQAAVELALAFLAVAASERGCAAEAGMLGGYLLAHATPSSGLGTPANAWVLARLREVLATMPERTAHEAAGAVASRRQIMNVVTRLDTIIGEQ